MHGSLPNAVGWDVSVGVNVGIAVTLGVKFIAVVGEGSGVSLGPSVWVGMSAGGTSVLVGMAT